MVEPIPEEDETATAYLHQLQTLAGEVDLAIHAISGNALSSLEESIARQEMLCASLASMARTTVDNLQSAAITAAATTVQTLNLKYASLLKHSGKSIALLSALCNSHTHPAQEARGPRLKHQTWSCEM